MKNSNGLAGKAFTEGKIVVDSPKEGSAHEILIAEEKDLTKLSLKEVRNALAIPVMDKQNGQSQAVLQVYNFDEAYYKDNLADGAVLWDLANMLSSVMFAVDNLQGTLATNDMLEEAYNLVNDGCIFVNAHLDVTKANKSAQVLLNCTSQALVGKQLSEALGPQNGHLMQVMQK